MQFIDFANRPQSDSRAIEGACQKPECALRGRCVLKWSVGARLPVKSTDNFGMHGCAASIRVCPWPAVVSHLLCGNGNNIHHLMNNLRTLLSLTVMLTLSGCIPTLHPLYTDKDIIFDPALVGSWTEEDAKETWMFQRNGEKAYRLVYTDGEGKTGKFDVHLVKIGAQRFLDFFPDSTSLNDSKQNDFFKFHLIPVHTFARVWQIEPGLQMAFPDPKWLEEYLKANPKALANEKIEDRGILTASTAELQEFLRKQADTEGFFGNKSSMRRKVATPAK